MEAHPQPLPKGGGIAPLIPDSFLFRRITYPPELSIRIFNPQYPAVLPPRKRGVEAYPDPLPWGGSGWSSYLCFSVLLFKIHVLLSLRPEKCDEMGENAVLVRLGKEKSEVFA